MIPLGTVFGDISVKNNPTRIHFKTKIMKTKIRKIRMIIAGSVVICGLFSGSAVASTGHGKTPGKNIQAQIRQLDNTQTMRLIVDNPDGNRITVTLSDVSGTFISRIVGGKNDKEVLHDYDFNGAEDGTYYLEIYDGHNTVKKEIHLQTVHQPDITQMSVK
jgi:hypothetical protein